MQWKEWESGTKRQAEGRKGSRVRFREIINSGHLERAGIFGEGKPENAWTLLRLHSMPVMDSWPVSSKFTLFAFFVKSRLGLLCNFLCQLVCGLALSVQGVGGALWEGTALPAAAVTFLDRFLCCLFNTRLLQCQGHPVTTSSFWHLFWVVFAGQWFSIRHFLFEQLPHTQGGRYSGSFRGWISSKFHWHESTVIPLHLVSQSHLLPNRVWSQAGIREGSITAPWVVAA
ncbi:unnamed protein product [Rangifer tarandus platyrhynchus]|uniref:Uncharacterized protein n=2 Tax=Rangifer tarandus platyrhynchus TaxID=3082113 RepID=A0ACB1MJQ8_RANTA|nr:unnamed protein product [Rangifer tarandus platyrhynchus]